MAKGERGLTTQNETGFARVTDEASAQIVQLFEQSPSFMAFLKGPEHRITHVNPGYMSLVGQRDVIGKIMKDAIPESVEQGFLAMLDTVFQSGTAITAYDARYEHAVTSDGLPEVHYVDLVFQPIRDSDGAITGILVQGSDVTERRNATQAIIDVRNSIEAASLAQADLLTSLSDGLRSSLTEIIALSDQLAATTPLNCEQAELIRGLNAGTGALRDYIDGVMDGLSIGETSELERVVFNPSALITDIAADFTVSARNKGLELILTTERADEALVGDPVRLRQILTQICANAIAYTTQGQIEIQAALGPEVSAMRSLNLMVRDTGHGMTTQMLEQLFGTAASPNAALGHASGNAGLGLIIARNLVAFLGGTITARSAPGVGTIFELSLPLSVPGDEAMMAFDDPPQDQVMTPAVEAQPIVLLVEDYEPNILVGTTLLKRLGFRVDVATNGRMAVEKAATGDYVLALMDVQMPGMDGLEATMAIRESEAASGRTHLPIVGVTAHSLGGYSERCIAAGMDDYLAKPFDASDLFEKIQTVLSNSARDELFEV